MGISIKREYILENLNCANCGAKIEREVGLVQGVESSVLDFVNKRLIVQLEREEDIDRVYKETWRIVKKFEPDVDVIDKMNQKQEKSQINRDRRIANDNSPAEGKVKTDSGQEDGIKKNNLKSNGFFNEKNKKEFIRLVLGFVLLATAMIFDFDNYLELGLYLTSYFLVGSEVLIKAGKNIIRGQVFDENFLMALATIGAFAIGEFPEGVSVMIFYQIGEFFQDMAVFSSRKSITELMNIKPDYANLVIGNSVQKVLPEEVLTGDFIIVKPGEKVPLDGKVVEGRSVVDTSALTGESVPRDVKPQDEILSGFINLNGLLKIQVSKEYGESTVSKILELVQNASSKKAKTENFITKFARVYTPIVVIAATLLAVVPPLIISGATFSEYIYKALIFLVVSCPCALVISIPLGFFGGIGGASKHGILIKGSNYLEALNDANIVVFDKTGTLTEGIFEVTKINATNRTKEEILKYAAYAESFSNHPIAVSILKKYDQYIDKSLIQNIEEIPGCGIMAEIDHKLVYLGNSKLMEQYGFNFEKVDEVGTIVHVAIDNNYCGNIVISDRVKATSKTAIEKLVALGIKKTVMLTGDNRAVAEKISGQLGIDEVYSELLPQNKVEKIEQLEDQKSSKDKLVFVGDGTNDAPVLARADIGIAMGGLGSDAAIEAADIVIMNDDPEKIATAIKIARKTRAIVMQNIIFAIGIKLIVMAMGAVGIATIWEAVFADVGVALIAVLNSMRAMKVSK